MLRYDVSLEMGNFDPTNSFSKSHKENKRNQIVTKLPLSLNNDVICVDKYILFCGVYRK